MHTHHTGRRKALATAPLSRTSRTVNSDRSNTADLEITPREARVKLRQHTDSAQLPSATLKTLHPPSTLTFLRASSQVSTSRCQVRKSLKHLNARFQALLAWVRTLAPVKSVAPGNSMPEHCSISTLEEPVQALTTAP